MPSSVSADPLTEREKTLLWGWDRHLVRLMAPPERIVLVRALAKRLMARAGSETDPGRSRLFTMAARGWSLVHERLAAAA